MALTRISGNEIQSNTSIQLSTIKSDIFFFNNKIATSNAVIEANTNAMSAGPIIIANNVTITISSGSRWVIM
jgi:hypothetical protein